MFLPEKVGQLKVTTVCLEHGKREPREQVPYEIKPLESVTTKAGVRELCESLGKDQLSQRAAQAAAWHLNNGMSWQELAAKQLRFANGTRRPYFTAEEIQGGMKIAAVAIQISESQQKPTTATSSSSDTTSISSAASNARSEGLSPISRRTDVLVRPCGCSHPATRNRGRSRPPFSFAIFGAWGNALPRHIRAKRPQKLRLTSLP